MTPIELWGNSSNLLSVFLAARNNVLTWPIGIVGCVLYGLMFFGQKLYADVVLQAFFIITSLIGWREWKNGGPKNGDEQHTGLAVGRVALTRFIGFCAAASVAAILFGLGLKQWTDASYPIADSHILMFSILGQLLLMRRLVESWICWIVVDTLAVPVYASKGLYLTSAVYAAFLVNAVFGYWSWRKLAHSESK